MRIIDFFDRVYIINLPERTDRIRHLKKEFLKLGSSLDSPNVEIFPAIKPSTKEPFTHIGYKGCFLSHLSILKKAREEGLENILILEDDVQFTPDFLSNETKIIDQLRQKEWDFIQFGYAALPGETLDQSLTHPSEPSWGTFVPFSESVTQTHCVAVNRRCLERLINFFEAMLQRPVGHPDGGPMSPDGAYNVFSWRPDTERLLLVPPLVGQVSSRSDISPGFFDRIEILQPLLALARELGFVPQLKRILKGNS